jgi:hypothetical protein
MAARSEERRLAREERERRRIEKIMLRKEMRARRLGLPQ